MPDREVPERWRGTAAEPYWMQQDACADLVAECGGNTSAAAREIGVSGSLLRIWLDPESYRERQRNYRRKNREKVRETGKRYYLKNAEQIRARARSRLRKKMPAGSHSRYDLEELRQLSYREMTKGQRIAAARLGIVPAIRSERERQLRARYGLTLEDYARLLESGDGCCWSCGDQWHTELFVDHDHETGEIRGLLCARCNTVAGYIDKHRGRFDKVRAYLNRHADNRICTSVLGPRPVEEVARGIVDA